MAELPVLKIFLSSPGDVAEERALAEIVFRRLADEVADTVHLVLVIWEHEPLFGHTGFQQQIERPSQCDLVVSILWSRLGTRLPSDFVPAPGEPAPTGTQFELQDALAAYAATSRPSVLIYRKIPGPQIALGSSDFAERTAQYHALDEFCRRTFYDSEDAIIVAHTTFTDSHDFERRLDEHVRRWLDRQIRSPAAAEFRPLWRGQSPFRGLQPFEAEHQAIFFGRSEALGDLMRRIRETESGAHADSAIRLLLVQGMSGAGKTSLFKASLLPLLDLHPVEGIAQWITVSLRPSESDPSMRELGALGVLASRLSDRVPAIARLGTSVRQLVEALHARPEEAVATIATCVAADADRADAEPKRVRLLIYVDQLEEIFTLPDSSATAESLFAALAALARAPTIWVAATLRSDFVHRLEAHPEFMQCLGNNASYTLMPPRSDELAEMIRGPARAAGLVWEQRGGMTLDQELLREAAGNPEALPLLEYTLAVLYERRDGRLLRWSDYGGGLRGALIAAADEVVGGISGDADTAFRDVMRELVSVAEDGVATRRYASLTRFVAGGDAFLLLERMVARRLCVTTDEGRGDGPVAYLAHEALIRSWPRAQQWLERETSLLRIRDELARDATVWDFHQRTDDWLGVSPEKLAAIRRIEEAGLMLGGAASDYAQRSRRRAARNRLIRYAAVAGICLLTVLASAAWLIALKQRNIALAEAKTADRTTRFMVSLFQLADPGENRGSAVTVKEVLDKGAEAIRNDQAGGLQGEPRVRAELLTAMGQAYSGLGLYKPAEALLSQARSDEKSGSVPIESRIRTLVASGSTAYLAADYDAAAAALTSAVGLARAHLDSSDPLRSQALSGLAEVKIQLEKYAEAEDLCREALAADRARGPQGAAVLAQTLDLLGRAYLYSGDLAAAEAPMREALSLRQQALGMRHSLTAISLDNLGTLLYQSGRYDEALSIYRQALPIYRAVYGPEHPEVASIINNIGRTALMTGRVEEAEPLLREALAMTDKFEGDTHDDLVSPLNSLAMIDAYHGRLDAARNEIERAASIARLPNHDELLDQVLLTEADLEFAAGNRARTAALLRESRAQLQRNHPNESADPWRYAVWDSVNAQLLAADGDHAGAARTLAAAQRILDQRFGANGFYSLLAKRRQQSISRTTG
ncbi:MAG: tetratricopeptide repeat protein [Steroidobacteraceae bacterium]